MYTVTHGTFRTPRGRDVTLAYREDTNDYNTLRSCLNEDEYRLRDLDLSGVALDIGAHIGGVTIALALDNPDLRVIAVEAVPPNAKILAANVEAAGVADRVTILQVAAGRGKTATIRWGFAGNETADHHAFIGNAVMPEATLVEHESVQVPVRTLASLVREFGPIEFVKIDCEGCEYDFLQGKALADVALIRGEVHKGTELLSLQLYRTHSYTYGSRSVPCGFEAVRRA